ncbi:hypothetical protein HQ45_07505 [Porphyromonas crevioricanis]|uniref:Lipoprotein n=1 Tax=Porphyromonas crevioricanis TaxID=393921 RepID=A0A0A2FTP1_9PORP|nr:DUF4810 domain-containing protein [Porphyromonas crevioricanis]KGN89370.1 hypothetical protein HQ45_07505 [Porphyromonas crevioricanis]KGN93552.1 hypothetical protein HQ38_08955 [Porphyromonas crevioricanis]SJZ87412.1 hypothetical protein SAMN02745203_01129 [Porphyromonas crevioricanis]SQH73160.1 Uncharacterised protein [Porphyromonas crevioricanis]
MKQLFISLLAVVLLSSCGVTNSLYYWGGVQGGTTVYEHLAYQSYDKQTPKSICNLITVYENMVKKPGGVRQVPPPGICAEYGYLLLQQETASIFLNNATASQKRLFKTDDYDALFQERGREMLQKEIELYPESAKFIGPLIKKLVR